MPNQPSISKSKNAEEIEFFYEKDFYNKDVFTNDELVSFEILGSMREVQLARIIISPISYNPVANEIEVVTNLEVEVNFSVKNKAINNPGYYSPEFEHLYKKCINYLPPSPEDIITTYPVKYVIVSDPLFQTALQPLIEWKTKKGFNVIEAYTNDPNVGTTTNSIKAYVKTL